MSGHAPLPMGDPGGTDDFTVIELVNAVLRQWRLVVSIPLLLAGLAAWWSLSQERTYVATGSFVSQSSSGARSSGASGLAREFGINLGAESTNESPQFYVELLRSRAILREAVESTYSSRENTNGQRWTLIEMFGVEPGRIPQWRRAVDQLSGMLTVTVARETGIIRISVSANDPYVAEQVVQRLLELVNEFNLNLRQSRAQEEERFISARIEEVQRQLNEAENSLQEFLAHNRAFENSPHLQFEYDHRQRQVMRQQEVYTTLLRSYEQARIDAVRDVPLVSLIDKPAGSAQPEGRGTAVRTALALVIGFMVMVFLAIVMDHPRRRSTSKDAHYAELRRLWNAAWFDIRHPSRWVRWQRVPTD